MRRSAIAIVLTLAIAAACPVWSFADKLSTYKAQQQQLKSQAEATKAKITQLTNQENALQQKIQGIQSQIDSLNQSISETLADIHRRNAQIAQLKAEIAKTQKEIQSQYQLLAQRVRLMYEAGHTNYLSVLFSATSFSDLLTRMQLLSTIAQQDQEILKQVQATKDKLDRDQAQLQRQQEAQQRVYAILLDRQQEQMNAEHTERTLLAQVHDAKLQEETDLQNENSQLTVLGQQIKQLEASMGSYSGPSGGWTWPVPGYHDITSGYGWRTLYGKPDFHPGIDIGAPVGTPIVAATSGKVLFAGPASGYGEWIVIDSGNGLLEIYGHMYSWELKVSPGETVKTGQVIAAVGSNGESTGPHLHFEIATGFDSSGYPISTDPTKYVGG
ncbi:MAG: peptidoglycan DD-metalloendopeptidase family protein [Alicyclobacillus sp.]|nr:peptidoglycan DD-metalloendopeptidase family protein [Alicyclobacillus sp.]